MATWILILTIILQLCLGCLVPCTPESQCTRPYTPESCCLDNIAQPDSTTSEKAYSVVSSAEKCGEMNPAVLSSIEVEALDLNTKFMVVTYANRTSTSLPPNGALLTSDPFVTCYNSQPSIYIHTGFSVHIVCQSQTPSTCFIKMRVNWTCPPVSRITKNFVSQATPVEPNPATPTSTAGPTVTPPAPASAPATPEAPATTPVTPPSPAAVTPSPTAPANAPAPVNGTLRTADITVVPISNATYNFTPYPTENNFFTPLQRQSIEAGGITIGIVQVLIAIYVFVKVITAGLKLISQVKETKAKKEKWKKKDLKKEEKRQKSIQERENELSRANSLTPRGEDVQLTVTVGNDTDNSQATPRDSVNLSQSPNIVVPSFAHARPLHSLFAQVRPTPPSLQPQQQQQGSRSPSPVRRSSTNRNSSSMSGNGNSEGEDDGKFTLFRESLPPMPPVPPSLPTPPPNGPFPGQTPGLAPAGKTQHS